MGDPPNKNNDYTVEATWKENGKRKKTLFK